MVGTSMAGEAERGPVGYFALDANGINAHFGDRDRSFRSIVTGDC